MLKAIAFGIACGIGLQSWRQLPPDGPVNYDSAALLVLVALVCAYLVGRGVRARYGTSTATAVAAASAEASAVASQRVNIVNVMPSSGTSPAGVGFPSESAPWLGEARQGYELDVLDGIELSDIQQSAAEDW